MGKIIKILIDATGGANWVGGLYYKKNILFSLLQNKAVCSKYFFVVATEINNYSVFDEFKNQIKLVQARADTIQKKRFELLKISLIYGCQFVFAADSQLFRLMHKIDIHWIPDFQHNRLPECFSEFDRKTRSEAYQKNGTDRSPVVLSSNDCLRDFIEYYHPNKNNIYVVHFVSYIEKEIRTLTNSQEKAVLEHYGILEKRYACIMNQFWQHKNHRVVINAMEQLYSNYSDCDFTFVFTGKMQDYRNPDYIESLKTLFSKPIISSHVKLLGFIEREEQIAIMKNAAFVIQPSLFEGWGTVVEDAKVLDKTILLSNIPVHREQMNEKCILFDPYDPVALVSFGGLFGAVFITLFEGTFGLK